MSSFQNKQKTNMTTGNCTKSTASEISHAIRSSSPQCDAVSRLLVSSEEAGGDGPFLRRERGQSSLIFKCSPTEHVGRYRPLLQ